MPVEEARDVIGEECFLKIVDVLFLFFGLVAPVEIVVFEDSDAEVDGGDSGVIENFDFVDRIFAECGFFV